MYDSLKDKVVLVTGAGNGIGLAIAERFAGVGAKVTVNDVDSASVDAAVASITDAGGAARGAVADVSDGDQVAAMFDALMAEHGRIDVLVNNAGIVIPMLHFF